jgi:integrase
MGRAPIPLDRAGNRSVKEVAPKKWRARCRIRRADGTYGQIERTGTTKTGAMRRLDEALRALQPQDETRALRGSDTVERAARLWLRKVSERVEKDERSGTTVDRYRHLVDHVITPRIGQLRVAECTPATLNAFFVDLSNVTSPRTGRRYSANHRRNVRTAMRGIMKLAVLQGIFAKNPIGDIERIESERRIAAPRAFTPDERRAFFEWFYAEDGDAATQKARQLARQRELPELLLLMAGTGLRIGEVCGLRWRDVELDGPSIMRNGVFEPQPLLAVTGNVVRINGRGLVRNVGKTEKALRIVPLPRFVADMLRARKPADADPDWPVFPSAYFRSGKAFWRSPEKTATHIADVRKAMGIPWKLTSHTFRKTAATIWHDMLTPRQAADLIGHSKISTLTDIYVGRGELHAEGAAVMDAAWLEME